MLTQDINSSSGFNFDFKLYDSVSFPTIHIHRSAELIISLDKIATVTIGSHKYLLEPGNAMLALPFIPHAFESENAKLAVCVFSKDCARDFYEYLGERRCSEALFRPSSAALQYFTAQLSFDRETECGRVLDANEIDQLTVTAVLSAILGSFLTQVTFDSTPGIGEKLLDHISLHSTEELTLNSLAAEFGYEPHYLSRIIGRLTGMNFRSLVNACRIEHAKELLKQSSTITEAALSSGFGSLRTFDRVFKESVGMSPGDWIRS